MRDELQPCFRDISYSGVREGATWQLDASTFTTVGERYAITVEASKGEGDVLRSASATNVVVPQDGPVGALVKCV